MIRLIEVGTASKMLEEKSQPVSPIPPTSNISSPGIRLGQRSKRISTLQPESHHYDNSPQGSPQGLTRLSFISQRLTPNQSDRPLMKIKMVRLDAKIEESFFGLETSGAGTALNALVERQKPAHQQQKIASNQQEKKEAYAGREIVKLKHHKRKSFSPIDKLARLLPPAGARQ